MRRRRRRHPEGYDRQTGIAGHAQTLKSRPRTQFGAFFASEFAHCCVELRINSQSVNHTHIKWPGRHDACAGASPMNLDWNTIRLELLEIDAPTRASLREMRPFFAKSLPGILARFYDKVRHYDPASGLFKDGVMAEAIRLQLQHWDLIGGGDFGLAYISSVTRICDFNQRAGVAPQWYIGCRLMYVADQLAKAVESEVQIPRFGQAAQAARDKKASMLSAIAKANMLDTENVVAIYFGA